MIARATGEATFVGRIPFVINQGDTKIRDPVHPGLVVRIALTFAVPFLVSMYSMLGMVPELRLGERSPAGGVYRCRNCPGPGLGHAAVGAGDALPSCPQCGVAARWIPIHA